MFKVHPKQFERSPKMKLLWWIIAVVIAGLALLMPVAFVGCGGSLSRAEANYCVWGGLMLGPVAYASTLPPAALALTTPAPTTPPPADASSVTVESVRTLPAVVDEADPWFAALSPDGAHLAYYTEAGRGRDRTGQICLYTFNSAAKMCYDLSRDLFLGYPYQLQWSPDSSMIAFTENPVDFGYDGDIWLFKVADSSFTNLTDDKATGSWRQETGTPSPNVDYLPVWNPADGQIYFWRFASLGEYLKFTLGIYRVAPEGGEAELVRDLTQAVPVSVPVFTQEQYFLDGPSAISPDGQSLATLLTTLDEFGVAQTGLWFINLADTEAVPQELMPPTAFNAALPVWQEFPAYPTGLAWTSDGQGVVAIAQSPSSHTPFTLFYYVDVESGSITPVVDFSSLPDPESYFEPAPGSDLLFRYFSPWTASLSPQGDKLLMVNDLGGVTSLLTAPLPPTGALPVVSAATEESTMSTASRSSRSQNGKMLVYGLLLTVKEE
jgi:dipeptidyl aminopeptidase/acylaminoacyl peptidase